MNSLRLPKLLLWTACMLFSVMSFAQDRTVTGKVTDPDGKPLEGVSVKVKNTTKGTSTNADGIFTISVPSTESVISISSVGYLIYEAKAGSGSTFNAQLTRLDRTLDDVVVVGYGSKKRVNVQGAVSTVKAADIEDLPVANLPDGPLARRETPRLSARKPTCANWRCNRPAAVCADSAAACPAHAHHPRRYPPHAPPVLE